MKRIRGFIVVTLGLCLVTGAAGGYWYYRDAFNIERHSFAERRALLEPYINIYLPDALEPGPAILFFHGCGGPGESDLPRARQAVEMGYVAIVVDSLTPRSLDWHKVCDGRVLQGPERSGDVFVALEIAREHPAINPGQLFLVGYSHGAWTILEALTFDQQLPPGLADSPGNHLAGVRAAVAWYPYCGFATTFGEGWNVEVPVMMLLAEKDEITETEPCEAITRLQAQRGKPVSYITYPGVSHGFDELADWVKLYDPAIHRQALEKQFSFFQEAR